MLEVIIILLRIHIIFYRIEISRIGYSEVNILAHIACKNYPQGVNHIFGIIQDILGKAWKIIISNTTIEVHIGLDKTQGHGKRKEGSEAYIPIQVYRIGKFRSAGYFLSVKDH